MKVLDLETAKQKAFRLLSLRPHSEKELEKKLREKGFPAVVVKETLEKLPFVAILLLPFLCPEATYV